MVLPIFRVDHLSSFQPLCKCPHRQALRFVFWMILSLIMSTVNASHYITLPLPSPIPAFSLLLAVSFPVLAPTRSSPLWLRFILYLAQVSNWPLSGRCSSFLPNAFSLEGGMFQQCSSNLPCPGLYRPNSFPLLLRWCCNPWHDLPGPVPVVGSSCTWWGWPSPSITLQEIFGSKIPAFAHTWRLHH